MRNRTAARVSEFVPNKTKRSHISRLLPMLNVFADWVSGNPWVMAQRVISDETEGLELELYRKENRLRSGLRVTVVSTRGALHELVSKSQSAKQPRGIFYERIELRGFPPLKESEKVKCS